MRIDGQAARAHVAASQSPIDRSPVRRLLDRCPPLRVVRRAQRRREPCDVLVGLVEHALGGHGAFELALRPCHNLSGVAGTPFTVR